MTEYNLFCYSEKYNDDNSFQQKRYRAFNKEVGEKRYYEIKKLVIDILPEQGVADNSSYWKSVTQEQWNQLLQIPEAKDFKEGFEYISGVKIEEVRGDEEDEEIETIKIGELVFNKQEVEERLKDLKPIN